MIDLFSVKFNGQYDEIGAMPTINNGLFLCDETVTCDCNCGGFVKGYTYQIVDGVPERVGQADDYKISKLIYPTIQNVCEWLNNWFTIKRNYSDYFRGELYGATGSYHELAQFPQTGDLCKIRVTDDWNYISTYNIYFVSYVTVDNGVVTSDNPQFKEGVTYFYYIMHLPTDVEKAISHLIYYDVFTRGMVDDLKSESTGNYSYSKEDVHIGSLAYPSALVAGLEACYRKVRFTQ